MSKGNQKLSLKDKLMYLFALEENLPKLIDIKSIPTQSIREYYVQPNLAQKDKDSNDKHPIELKDIISQEGNHKSLLEGGVGVGKTAILQRISHGWSEDEVIKSRYDYIFKLKLKLILSDWQKKYSTEELESNKLAYFIYYAINKLIAKIQTQIEYKPEYKITIHEVIEAINNTDKDRILLLLDGDNDLNALLKDDEASVLIYEMVDFPNLIMTSRANSLPAVFINEFDTRVEVTGFLPNEARQYINKYFFYQSKTIGERVEEFFLTEHPGVDLKKDLLESLSRATRRDTEKYEVFLQLKKIDNFLPDGLGSTKEEIQLSIFKYYQESQELLNKLLEEATVKDLLENPMITSMVCLVFGDPESRLKLVGDLTVGNLYEEFMVWLSKKYLSSFGVEIEEITREMIMHSKEISVLKEIAFYGMQHSNLIDGVFISGVARERGLDINRLYNLGLLKVVVYDESAERESLVSHKHSFARVTVQDYLSALSLKEKLMSEDKDISDHAANFIAEHRNEKQYLMMLKFIAEMITKDPSVSQKCLDRFWEAITCNIDGVLEFGMHMKVTLLMHLMTSAKINGEIDARIPNREEIIYFINRVVSEDLLRWGEEIKASGYVSADMRECIWDKWFALDSVRIDDHSSAEEAGIKKESFYNRYHLSEFSDKSIDKMPDISNLANIIISAIDYLDNKRLLDSIDAKLANENYQIKEVAIKMVHQLAKRSKKEFDYAKIEFLIENIIQYITDKRLKEHAIDALASLVEISDNHKRLVLKILGKSFPFLKDKAVCDGVVKLIIKVIVASEKKTMINSDEICTMTANCGLNMKEALWEGLTKIYQDTLRSIDYEGIEHFISFSSDAMDSSSLSPQKLSNKLIVRMSSIPEEDILAVEKEFSHSSTRDALDNIASVIIGMVNNGLLEMLDSAFDYFISSLRDEQREEAAYIIYKIVQKSPNTLNIALNKLIPLLTEGGDLKNILLFTINNILQHQKAKINTEIAYSLIDKLKSFLSTKDSIDKDLVDLIILAIGNIVSLVYGISPEKITELLTELIRYDDGSAEIYRAIAQIAEFGEESVLETAFDLLITASSKPSSNLAVSLEISLALSKITKAINSEIIEVTWIARLVEEIKVSTNNKAIFIIPIAHILSKGRVGTEYVGEIVDVFIQLLIDLDNPMSNRMIDAICICGKGGEAIKEIFFTKLFATLKQLTLDNEINSRLVEAISKLGYGVKGNEELFEILVSDLIFDNLPISTVAHSIANSIQGSKELSVKALSIMSSLLENEDKIVVQKVLYIIGKIVKKDIVDALMLEGFLQKIIPLLESEFFREKALYVISKISAKEGVVIVNFEGILRKLMNVPGSEDSIKAQNSALFAIGEIAYKEVIPAAMKPEILKVLGFSIGVSSTKSVALEALSKIINVMRLEESITLLESYDPEVRALASEVLSIKVKKPQAWDFKVVQILNILSRNNYESDSEIKKLHDLAKKMLNIQIGELEEANLHWINSNFERLLDISEIEFEAMSLKLYDLALSDSVISRVESTFVINCIKHFGFTNVIYSPKTNKAGEIEFKILFNNKIYIFLGEKNLEYLERIASALIASEDMLAGQYRDNVPLFYNSGAGIKVAASDIKSCKSIVSGEELLTNSCQASLLFLSDHHKSSPKEVFLLLERRVLGYYVVDKVSFKNQKIQIFHKIIYPEDIDSFRELIFTKMDYVDSKVTYYGKTWWLDSKAAADLVSKFFSQDTMSSLREAEESIHFGEEKLGDAAAVAMVRGDIKLKADSPVEFLLFNPITIRTAELADYSPGGGKGVDYLGLMHLLEDMVVELSGHWEEDLKILIAFSKKTLLKKSTSLESVRIEDHDRTLTNAEEIREIKKILKNINIEVLESLIDKEKLAIKDRLEIQIIEDDPYQYAFYKALIWQLNSVYIASSSIHSQMIENIDSGTAGNIASFLGFVSAHTPLVGMGVDIIGQVFQGIDKFKQGIKVDNYFHIAQTSEEMSRLAEIIARTLVLAKVRFSDQAKIPDALGAVGNVLGLASQLSISSVVNTACQNFKKRLDIIEEEKDSGDHPKGMLEYVARFALNQHESTPTRRGEIDAEMVAKIIVENIFSGKYLDHKDNSQLIESIIQDVYLQAVDPAFVENSAKEDGTPDLNPTSVEKASKKEECCCSSCIVMKVQIEKFDNPILNHKSFLDMFKAATSIDKEQGFDRLLKLGEDKEKYAKFLSDVEGKATFTEAIYRAFIIDSFEKFLEIAKLYFSEKEIDLLRELGEDELIAEQIMNASRERGISDVIDDLFSRSKARVEQGDGRIEDNKIIEYIDQYRKIIGDEGFRDHPELYKYEDAVIFKNKYPSIFSKMMKKAVDLASNIQNLLDKEAWYEFLGIDTRDQVAINWAQLNGLLEFMTSAGGKLPILRPPFYDPGDDFGDSGGGSSGGASRGSGNNTDGNSLWIPASVFDANSTDYILLNLLGGSNTTHSDNTM